MGSWPRDGGFGYHPGAPRKRMMGSPLPPLKPSAYYHNQEVNPYDPPNSLDASARISINQDGSLTAWLEFLARSNNPDSNFLLPQGLFINFSKHL